MLTQLGLVWFKMFPLDGDVTHSGRDFLLLLACDSDFKELADTMGGAMDWALSENYGIQG